MIISIFFACIFSPMIYCLVEVSVLQSIRKGSISSVAFVLHISQCV